MAFFRNPYVLLIIVTAIWGGNAVAGRFAVGHVSPMVLTMLRWAMAFLVVLPFAWPYLKADAAVIRKHWLYLLAMGAIGYTVFNGFLYTALRYTSAINVTLEQSAMPLIIFLLNYLIYRIGVRWLQIVGYGLTAIGVLVVVSAGEPFAFLAGAGAGLNRGDVMMLGAAFAYGGYSVAVGSKPDMHWLSFLACLIFAAFLAAVPALAIDAIESELIWPASLQGWLVVVYAGLLPSIVAQGCYIQGIQALGANRAGLFINLVPVFGALFSVLLLDDRLHLFHAVAFLLVAGGITLAQREAPSRG